MADLKAQLELSNHRETDLIDEKAKLLDLLTAEKEEKRALMPPPEKRKKTMALQTSRDAIGSTCPQSVRIPCAFNRSISCSCVPCPLVELHA